MGISPWFASRRHLRFWLGLALVVCLLDQGIKTLAVASLSYGVPVPMLPGFNLTLLHNTGAAFSLLDDASGWQRWFLSGVAVVVGIKAPVPLGG